MSVFVFKICCAIFFVKLVYSELSYSEDHLPLMLTPYITSGNISGAQRAAFVNSSFWTDSNIESYAGFLTVNEVLNSNLFSWVFPSEHEKENSPVLVWLEGGPGSSCFEAITEGMGPLYVDSHGSIREHRPRFSRRINMVYIDSPVGTGFSFTASDSGYSTTDQEVSDNLLSALLQIFEMFPYFRERELYISGESYGGKFAVSLSMAIHTHNQRQLYPYLNLRGITIGNGMLDPEKMSEYAKPLFYNGFVDNKGFSRVQKLQEAMVDFIKQKDYTRASDIFFEYFMAQPSLLSTITGYNVTFDIRYPTGDNSYGSVEHLVRNSTVRRALHVGSREFSAKSQPVKSFLHGSLTKSVTPRLEELLENYRVLFYNGQLDLMVPYSLTMNYLLDLKWSGKEEFRDADYVKWYVGDELAGYYKTSGHLSMVTVRNAGHKVPASQPEWAVDLMESFVFNKKL